MSNFNNIGSHDKSFAELSASNIVLGGGTSTQRPGWSIYMDQLIDQKMAFNVSSITTGIISVNLKNAIIETIISVNSIILNRDSRFNDKDRVILKINSNDSPNNNQNNYFIKNDNSNKKKISLFNNRELTNPADIMEHFTGLLPLDLSDSTSILEEKPIEIHNIINNVFTSKERHNLENGDKINLKYELNTQENDEYFESREYYVGLFNSSEQENNTSVQENYQHEINQLSNFEFKLYRTRQDALNPDANEINIPDSMNNVVCYIYDSNRNIRGSLIETRSVNDFSNGDEVKISGNIGLNYTPESRWFVRKSITNLINPRLNNPLAILFNE